MDQQIWDGIVDAERMVRYFQRLSDKLRLWQQILTIVLVTAASGAVASLLAEFDASIAAFVMVGVAGGSTWLYFADYSGKAAAARMFHFQYKALASEWRRLWYSVDVVDQSDVQALKAQENALSSMFQIPIDRKLNEKCSGEVYEIVRNEFEST